MSSSHAIPFATYPERAALVPGPLEATLGEVYPCVDRFESILKDQ